MSDQERILVERWQADKPAYEAWGRYVCDRLTTLLRHRLGDDAFTNFLKIPIGPRLKTDSSFVEKAIHRKNYAHPYEETEDKVGIRLVVLLEVDLRAIEEVLCAEASWTSVKSRDHEAEIASNPYEFGYQSLHYIVRSRAGIEFAGFALQEDMPCEIQIRTLLQHAHSELTHDTLYKPSVVATPVMMRAAAKSMALIEATGDYFASLANQIKVALGADTEISSYLSEKYLSFVGSASGPSSSSLNQLLIDRYRGEIEGGLNVLDSWLDAHPYIVDHIRERAASKVAFTLPAILLVYFCVATAPRKSKRNSPLNDRDLEPVYVDLGKQFAD